MKSTAMVALAAVACFSAHSQQYGWVKVAQLKGFDSTSFPLKLGNRWYYKYITRNLAMPDVHTKEIVDTIQGGSWVVRTYKLHQDSITLGRENWTYANGKFYDDSIILYDSSLTHDTSWSVPNPIGENSYSYTILSSSFQGEEVKGQAYYNRGFSIGVDYNHYSEVYRGIGIYYTHDWGIGGETGFDYASTLVGFMADGILYGDTLLTSVDNDHNAALPNAFALSQNYPNPFNPATTIQYDLPEESRVRLTLYDILGREVARLIDGVVPAGYHKAELNASNIASGVYFYRLEASATSGRNSFNSMKKMLVLK